MLLVAALLLCTLFVGGSSAYVLAQDASPEASPTGATCVAPEGPPGTPEPMTDMTGDTASPAAEEATPAEAPPAPPTGTPVEDQAVIDQVTAAASNIAACLTEGNYLGALSLTTSNFRLSTFGTDNIYTVATFLEGYVPGSITEVHDVVQLDGGAFGIDYASHEGKAVYHTFDVFVDVDGTLMLDSSYELEPETSLDSQTITVVLGTAEDEFAMTVEPASFAVEPATAFLTANNGTMGHEFVILQVPDGFDPASLTNPSGPDDLPDGVSYLGSTYLEPGQTGTLLFEGLEPGNYVGYCFIPLEDGMTHAQNGMYAAFTITAPVDLGIPDVVGTPAS
jgi:uncharacterized cupredoxin-like copper-binding protein